MIPRLVPFLLVPLAAYAFSFTLESFPSQCHNLTINVSGGVPPYEITLLPVIDYGVHTIGFRPFYDVNTSSTSWSEPLLFPAGAQLVIVLSDATGFGTGGTSDIYTVATGTTGCLPSYSFPLDFTWSADLDNQGPCELVIFSFSGNYQLPIFMNAVIPGGDSWALPTVTKANATQTWSADVKPSTQAIFMVGDMTGKGAGGVNAMSVGSENDKCFSSNSPGPTSGAAAGAVSTSRSASASSASSMSSTSSASATSSAASSGSLSSSIRIGPIVGGVIGGLTAIILISLCLFCVLRRRRPRRPLNEKGIGLQPYPFAGTSR